MRFMGIDGGGTSLRAVVVDDELNIVADTTGSAVNPNTVGFEQAQRSIREAIRAVSQGVNIDAVGIGIAGAPDNIAGDWLLETVTSIVPDALVVCSSDQEIALVGAHGQRYGVLVLAGTGSLAYGINNRGESVIVGGWGPLAGDEGSGYWIGTEAIKAVFRTADGRGQPTTLVEAVYSQLGLEDEWALLKWRYRYAHTTDVARLTPEVLRLAEDGDPIAHEIIETAANDLAIQAKTVMKRLRMDDPPIAFTGGILQRDNMLSRKLCQLLGLDERPVAKHSPVIGAALLAKEKLIHG
jgi:glucosamine kinase